MEPEFVEEIHNIQEWSPFAPEVWSQIPESIEITCVDACENFLVFGSSKSLVYWFDRRSGKLQTFRLEDTSTSSSCTVIKIASSVEFMVAVGTNKGQVNIFQIPKEVPEELQGIQNKKSIRRFIVRDLHRTSVKCCAWSRNAMQLFSGDSRGLLVQTTFDYSSDIIKSYEIMDESYEIVQISVNKSDLLVSSIYRSVICSRKSESSDWTIKQVGTKERSFLGPFGGEFLSDKTEIICSRPGLRFWVADTSGTVNRTLLFKDAFQQKPFWDIPLLNPSRMSSSSISNFGIPKLYLDDYVVVWNPTSIHILSLEKLQIEASSNGFRNIVDVCISDNEIFILESNRSLIRLAPNPDTFSYPSSVMVFNNMILEEIGIDSMVANAEEAIESESLRPIDISPDNIEQKLEEFDKIGTTDFESRILYSIKGGKHKPKKCDFKSAGIVEIGCSVVEKVVNNPREIIHSPEDRNDHTSAGVVEHFDECVGGKVGKLHIWNYLQDKENLEVQTTPRRKLHFIRETIEPETPDIEIDLTKVLPLELKLSDNHPKTSESNTSSEWEFLDT